MPKNPPNLADAYALRTPEDNKRLYANWAQSYDIGFAQKMDYLLPVKVAQAFASSGGRGPILDIGAGTGLAGEAIAALGLGPVDATDISPEMLDIARQKQIYQKLFVGDMTKRLPIADNTYSGIISSGTFTTGHVGPEALDEVIRVAANGALIVLTIHPDHFETKGFAAKFESLAQHIGPLKKTEISCYGDNTTEELRSQKILLVHFSKA